MCEKYLANGKDVFWAFMDLAKAYDTIDRHGMWQMLRVYSMVVVFTIFNLAGLILYLTKIILYVNYDGSRCNSSIVAQA